jgi:hypothetical protein
MAKIFTIHGGERETWWGTLPWPDCVKGFELDEMSGNRHFPKFKRWNKDAVFPNRVVVQIEDPEARENGTKPGYFVSPLHGAEARAKLDELKKSEG